MDCIFFIIFGFGAFYYLSVLLNVVLDISFSLGLSFKPHLQTLHTKLWNQNICTLESKKTF